MRPRLLIAPIVVLLSFTSVQSVEAQDAAYEAGREIALTYPDAPMPSSDLLVEPPTLYHYFPMRPDGQAAYTDNENAVNMTEAMNHFYYNPDWRGEVWAPNQNFLIVEKGVRMLSTWPTFDAATMSRKFTGVHKFFEKWSGFGP